MQRIHFASERRDDEDKGGFSKTQELVLYWRLLCATINVVMGLRLEFMGKNKHWHKQVRDRNVRDSTKSQNHRWSMHRET